MTHEEARTHDAGGSTDARRGRAAGFTIGIATVVMVVFMVMHPTMHTHELSGFVDEMGHAAVLNGVVHGTLMGTIAVLFLGFLGFAGCLGMRSMMVRAGLVAYGIGTVGLINAALVNGFIVPALAAKYTGVDHATLESLRPMLVLCHVVNGAFDVLGIVAFSAAVLAWSLVMLRRSGGVRAIGALGLVVSAAPCVLLLTGNLPMNVHGFGAFVLAQGAWYVAVAVLLVRGRI
jgi:hypothetical protein